MEEIKGNLWDFWPEHIIVITTNGFVKNNGECVMGRGCAREARDRFPWIAKWLGDFIKLYGNHVYYLGEGIVSFPVKHNWWKKSDFTLIERSTQELVAITNKMRWPIVVVPRPGCGNGGLDWKDVKPILEKYLDDRFKIITFG